MHNIWIIAQKEVTDILRNRIFILTVSLLVILTLVSLLVSESVFRDQVTQYEKAFTLLQEIGKTPNAPAPQLYPLNLLRGVVDYIEIVGAILGIFLGYLSVVKEKSTKAIKLILTRAVTKQEITLGKLLGNGIFVLALMAILAILSGVSLSLFAGALVTWVDVFKLLLFVALSSLYVLIFFCVSFFLSLLVRTPTNALIASFSVWLVLALIIPQIGDTMDPDNQVPGGFFKSMGLTKPQELKVLGHFAGYETVRNGVEELSITKQYERSVFGIFGIKKIYNGVPLTEVFRGLWGAMLTIGVFFGVGVLANLIFMRRSQRFLE